jgi:uncharacterized protein YaiI (UPF0178 family)
MKIWIDADACPVVIKEILYKASERKQIETTFVANRALRVPRSVYLKTLQVEAGFDVADNEIVRRLESDDLVITADIPLAAQVIEKGGQALSPRGELFEEDSIKSRLSMRDFMDSLRDSGVDTGGPAALSQSDRQKFANSLDKVLARCGKT